MFIYYFEYTVYYFSCDLFQFFLTHSFIVGSTFLLLSPQSLHKASWTRFLADVWSFLSSTRSGRSTYFRSVSLDLAASRRVGYICICLCKFALFQKCPLTARTASDNSELRWIKFYKLTKWYYYFKLKTLLSRLEKVLKKLICRLRTIAN